MKYLPRVLLLSLAGAVSSAFSQTDLSFIFTQRPKNTFSAAIKIRTSGSEVSFSNLGNVPIQRFDPSNARFHYDDGFVDGDGKRGNELAAAAGDFYDNNTRYKTYSTDAAGVKTQTGDFLAYAEGKTRSWGYNDATQVDNGFILMHQSYAASNGATAEADGGGSAGFDLQLGRDLGALGKKGTWGIAFSIGLDDINGKVSKTITADLVTITDRYDLFGQPAPGAPYEAPHVDPTKSTTSLTFENTVPISQNPAADSPVTTIKDGATINGQWQVKASYYLVRLGPQFRYQFNRRFSISGAAGPAAAILGSTFRADQTIDSTKIFSPNLTTEVRKTYFKIGGYAELNAEYWLTFRTGFFGGVVYEHLGKYEQELLGQKASVDLGSGMSFRLGVITRF